MIRGKQESNILEWSGAKDICPVKSFNHSNGNAIFSFQNREMINILFKSNTPLTRVGPSLRIKNLGIAL